MIKVIPEFTEKIMGYQFSKNKEGLFPKNIIEELKKSKNKYGKPAYPMIIKDEEKKEEKKIIKKKDKEVEKNGD